MAVAAGRVGKRGQGDTLEGPSLGGMAAAAGRAGKRRAQMPNSIYRHPVGKNSLGDGMGGLSSTLSLLAFSPVQFGYSTLFRVNPCVVALTHPFTLHKISVRVLKVAVFLVDTEGSLDYERSKDTSVKLSALSMLLSSYLIYNVGMMVKETDLEYLEMFVHVAEGVGKSFSLQPIERLDLLVRDWFCPPVYGVKGGQDYLQNTIKKVEGCSKYQKSLQTLRTRSRCYLMPFPGKKVAMGEGAVKDMDEDFKDCLKSYINSLLGSVQQCVKKDMENHQLTCEQLAGKIKKFTEIMKRAEYGFSSPLEMKMVLNNHMTLERAKEEYQKFREEQVVTNLHSQSVLSFSINQSNHHPIHQLTNP
nr:PREDICTED: RING finger protein 112-like [Latimeria chalumnae]|eukprot:XP_014349959.1 PREDICTED: RING finger protein 112-like [Latimeria chalumnae]